MTRKVLIVEDNEVNRKLVVDMVNHHNLVALEAEDAVTAINLTNEESPDLILMDIQLNGTMSGIEAVQMIKSSPKTKHIPIIAITAFAMQGDRERILASGCEGYIAKPFSMQQLVETLEKYVGAEAAVAV